MKPILTTAAAFATLTVACVAVAEPKQIAADEAAIADWHNGAAAILIPQRGFAPLPEFAAGLDPDTGLPNRFYGGGCVITQEETAYRFLYNQTVRRLIEKHGLPAYARPRLARAMTHLSETFAAAVWQTELDCEVAAAIGPLLERHADAHRVMWCDGGRLEDALLVRIVKIEQIDGVATTVQTDFIFDIRYGGTVAEQTTATPIRRCGMPPF